MSIILGNRSFKGATDAVKISSGTDDGVMSSGAFPFEFYYDGKGIKDNIFFSGDTFVSLSSEQLNEDIKINRRDAICMGLYREDHPDYVRIAWLGYSHYSLSNQTEANRLEWEIYFFKGKNILDMATPVIYPIQVEGDPIEKHWGECQVSSLIYEEELRCQSWTPIRYELKSTENDWDEVSQTEFYQATERQKRTLCSENSKLNFTLEYEYEAASQATRIESTYLQIHKQQLLVEKFSVICEETVEQTSEQVNRLEKVILDANLDRVTDVQKWIEQTDTQLNQPIEESDIDDILQMVKGVV